MILVVVLQSLLSQIFQLDAVGAQFLEDLVFVDRMGLVEADDRLDVRLHVQVSLLTLCMMSIVACLACAPLTCTVPGSASGGQGKR